MAETDQADSAAHFFGSRVGEEGKSEEMVHEEIDISDTRVKGTPGCRIDRDDVRQMRC
jgi:hypothetical protein